MPRKKPYTLKLHVVFHSFIFCRQIISRNAMHHRRLPVALYFPCPLSLDFLFLHPLNRAQGGDFGKGRIAPGCGCCGLSRDCADGEHAIPGLHIGGKTCFKGVACFPSKHVAYPALLSTRRLLAEPWLHNMVAKSRAQFCK